MNKKDYQKEINPIEASNAFKKRTIALLEEELEAEEKNKENESKKKKIIWFTPKKITVAIVTVAVFGASAVVIRSITGMQESVAMLQEQTNFGVKTFEGEELVPNLQAAQVIGENFSNYFSPQSSPQPTENEYAPDVGLRNETVSSTEIPQQKASEQTTQEALEENSEKTISTTQWPSKNPEYLGIFAEDITQDLAIQTIEIESNSILPIYKNNFQQTKTGYIPDGLSQQDMETILFQQATALIMEVQGIEPQSIAMNEGQTAQGLDKIVGTTTNQDIITVYRDGKVEINYTAPLILSIGTRPDPEKDLVEQKEYLALLIDEYQPLLAGMVSPAEQLTKTYGEDGTVRWNYEVYEEGNKTSIERLIGESFTKLSFSFDEDGKLKQINMQRAGALTQTENLALKSQEQAQQELLENKGFTFYEQDVAIEESLIAATELIYWNLPTGQFRMPYYKFYIEQEPIENQAEGITRYIEYYVLAV